MSQSLAKCVSDALTRSHAANDVEARDRPPRRSQLTRLAFHRRDDENIANVRRNILNDIATRDSFPKEKNLLFPADGFCFLFAHSIDFLKRLFLRTVYVEIYTFALLSRDIKPSCYAAPDKSVDGDLFVSRKE